MTDFLQQDWPFTDSRNVAVFSTQGVVSKEKSILLVCHDLDDGAWQFQPGEEDDEDEPKILSLERMVRIDPSIKELADLPLGWVAIRESSDRPWQHLDRTQEG